MDFNEIKNRAKDFLADRAEPREGQDDQAARRVDDDPAARTDPVRIDSDAAAGRASRGRADDRAGAITDEPVGGGPGPDRVDPGAERVAPEPERVDARADRPAPEPDPGPRAERPAPSPDARAERPADPDPRLGGSEPVAPRPAAADDPGRQRDAAAGASRSAAAATTPPGAAGELPADPERLVTAERADSYGARWREVQGEFVDEPRRAVGQADALVEELLGELGQLFDRQRRGIEQGLDRDDVSTEELRVALRRYRSFFDRLLSV